MTQANRQPILPPDLSGEQAEAVTHVTHPSYGALPRTNSRLGSKLNLFPGMKHLDVAGGTWDVAFRILDTINSIKHRARRDPLGGDKSLTSVEGDAEALRFEDNSMDGYTIAFGIRNVTHIEKVLSEVYRSV